MRRKTILFLILILFIMFGYITKADALCTSRKYNNLKMTAYKSTVNYELRFDEANDYYFILTVNNLDKDIVVRFNDYEYKGEDGKVEFFDKLEGGETYEVELYGGEDTACPEEYLYTKRITVPKYNAYSERDECIEYEEFYLCNKWYAGYIPNDTYFTNELNDYIISLNRQSREEKPIEEKSILQKIISFYTNNLIITLPITIIIILFVIYKIIVKIVRRRNRIKLNS